MRITRNWTSFVGGAGVFMRIQIQKSYNKEIRLQYSSISDKSFSDIVKRDMSFELANKIIELVEIQEVEQHEDEYPDGVLYRMEFDIIRDWNEFVKFMKLTEKNYEYSKDSIKVLYWHLIKES